jgi:hypothetical protein
LFLDSPLEQVDNVYFPTNGMISLVAVTGHALESGLTGTEGAVNALRGCA